MKNLLRYLNIATLFIALSALFVACSDNDDNGDGNLGLNIKVFYPTVVVPGTPMTINGSGFGDVTEIMFPGDISVTEFEKVTNEMIRVKAPQGLSQEGTISVKNAAGDVAVSRLQLTIGNTVIKGYSAEAGSELEGNQTLTVYGLDMQFVSGAEFLDENDGPYYVPASEFLRVAPGRVVIQIPAKVKEGEYPVKIYIGSQVVESPVFKFKPASDGGHWEFTKRYIWENTDPAGNGAVSWNGLYRFANVDASSGEEIATISMDDWALIKEGEAYLLYNGNESSNVRITTGWWTSAYGGDEHNCIDMAVPDPETGLMSIALDFKGDGHLYDNLDAQHLLFTGSDYTPMGIYVLEKKWVGGEGHFEKYKVTYWKNGEHSTIPAPSWSGEGRFSSTSNATGEETWAFTDEEWEILKSEPFRIAIEKNAEWVNLRVTTGWWSTNYMGLESLNDMIEQDEDGTYFVEINLANDPALLDLIDAQHLLFTGADYKLLAIYQEKEVWVGGGEGGSSETVIWENDGTHGEISWDGAYRFCNAEHMTGEEIFAIPMDQWDVIKNGSFWLHAKGSDWVQMRITTGWWSTTWTGDDINTGNERIIDNGDGTYDIEINFKGDPILDLLDEQHLLFTGSGYTPLKLYYK